MLKPDPSKNTQAGLCPALSEIRYRIDPDKIQDL
jgi:hypothetical protein